MFEEDSNRIRESMDLNDYVNEYFANIGSKLARECTPGVANNRGHNAARTIRDAEFVEFIRNPITPDDVLKVCNGINICKSASIPNVNKLLSDVQHRFRKGKSTVSAIAAFFNELYKNINENKNSYIIYLDLKKAFDTIMYTKLIHKLHYLGMDELTLKWFESYLTGRQQCVKPNDLTSNTLPITYGVPRGQYFRPNSV